ncbi:MAG: metallophosphoesterase [bacterium]
MHRMMFYRITILFLAILVGLIQFYFFKKARRKLITLDINNKFKQIMLMSVVLFLTYVNSPYFYFLIFGRPHGSVHPVLLYAILYPFGIWTTASFALFAMLVIKDSFNFIKNKMLNISLPWKTHSHSPKQLQSKGISRRRFLKLSSSATSLGFLASPVIATTYGAIFEKRFLEVEKLDMSFPNLPESLKGLKIVQVSDIHSSVYTTQEEIEKVVEQVNRLEPDILAVTGDFVSSSKVFIKPCVEAFSKARAKYGVFGCLGNHDYYVGAQEVIKEFRDIGFEMLVNSGVTLLVRGVPLNILGVDDLWQGRPNLVKTLGQVDSNNFNLLLCHQPNYFPTIQFHKIELTLAGHTHGGQIALNFFGSILSFSSFATPYLRGLFEENHSKLYVNRGIGITGPPIRFNSPPEITVITLN